jgi:hypothetical protein
MAAKRGMARPAASAPTFPLYGLDATWAEQRALDWICEFTGPGTADPMTYGIWLGHLTADGRAGVRVGTFDRRMVERVEIHHGRRPDRSLASARTGALALVDLTLPGMQGRTASEHTRQLAKALPKHALTQAERRTSWPRVTWHIDGTLVEAPVWRFAGGWTGFSDVLADQCLVLVGVGVPPGGLRLTRIADSRLYGVDLAASLDRAHHWDEVRDWQETILPRPNLEAWHDDQLALVSDTQPPGDPT